MFKRAFTTRPLPENVCARNGFRVSIYLSTQSVAGPVESFEPVVILLKNTGQSADGLQACYLYCGPGRPVRLPVQGSAEEAEMENTLIVGGSDCCFSSAMKAVKRAVSCSP